mgnify:FL=1
MDEARKPVLEKLSELLTSSWRDAKNPAQIAREIIPLNLEEAYSRVLANEAIASRDQPPFDASSMDGYALKKIDKLSNKKLLVVYFK